MCVGIFVCVCTNTCVCISFKYTCVGIYTNIYVYIYTNVCMYVRIVKPGDEEWYPHARIPTAVQTDYLVSPVSRISPDLLEVYIYMYVYIYVHVHVCIYVDACVRGCLYVYVRVYVCACMVYNNCSTNR